MHLSIARIAMKLFSPDVIAVRRKMKRQCIVTIYKNLNSFSLPNATISLCYRYDLSTVSYNLKLCIDKQKISLLYQVLHLKDFAVLYWKFFFRYFIS